MELLAKFFNKELISVNEPTTFYDYNQYEKHGETLDKTNNNESSNLSSTLKSKKKLKPLMKSLTEISPPRMHYLGTSFGLTSEIFGFWLKNGFKPLYIRQTANEITAEHSVIMTKMLENTELGKDLSISSDWLQIFSNDFERRFVSLLSFEFRHFPLEMCLKILEPRLTTNKQSNFEENA